MRTSIKLSVLLCCVAALAAACSDGSLFGNSFNFQIRLTDVTGQGVGGITARLHVPLDGFAPVAAEKRARTVIEFGMPRDAHAELDIVDLDGHHLRTLIDSQLPAGWHSVSFDATTDSGLTLTGTQAFYVEAVFREEPQGTRLWHGQSACVLYTGPDLGAMPVLGVTDSEGRLEYEDKTPFPFLWDLPDFEARDASGLPAGTFRIPNTVELWLRDEATGETQVTEVTVAGWGAQEVIEWDPPAPVPGKPQPVVSARKASMEVPELPMQWELRVCYPNPFR